MVLGGNAAERGFCWNVRFWAGGSGPVASALIVWVDDLGDSAQAGLAISHKRPRPGLVARQSGDGGLEGTNETSRRREF